MLTIKKTDHLFWIFIFIMILLQLSNDNELTFLVAFIYSLTIVITLRIHVIYAVSRLIKRYLKTKNTVKIIISTSLISIVTALILTAQGYFITTLLSPVRVQKENEGVSLFFGMLIVTILVSGVSYSLELFKQNMEAEKKHQELRNSVLEAEKKHQELRNSVLESEIDHLRTQLSPHFTFNILNNLQFLIRKDKDEALELLSKYSEILRYYVYESRNKWIKLDDEISFLKHYFQLEKDRSGEDLQISCQWDIPDNQLMIIPFVLSTFVENAFKHISNFPDSSNYIHLHIFLRNETQLFLKIENSTDSAINGGKEAGVGLKYVRKRLELSYPDSYKLELFPQEDKYSVQLQLNLNKK